MIKPQYNDHIKEFSVDHKFMFAQLPNSILKTEWNYS